MDNTFWKFNDSESKVSINFEAVLVVSKQNGFRLHNGVLVQIEENRIFYRDNNFYFDYLKSLIKIDNSEINSIVKDKFERDMLSQGYKLIKRLPNLDTTNILQDEKLVAYKFFANGYIQITATKIYFFEYDTLVDKLIWDHNVVDRDWSNTFSEEFLYKKFISNSVGLSDYTRLLIGYLTHDFNEEGKGYLVVLTDKVEDKREGGGTGKNVFSSLLKLSIKTFDISAEQIRFDSSFMQSWSGQRLFIISDAGKKFNWDFLKNLVTGNTQQKKLYQDEIQIDFKDMPKYLISTNLSVPMEDGGINRRVRILEFSRFYKENIGVDAFHGGMFPQIWTVDDWFAYDHFIAECLQFYFDRGGTIDQVEISNTGEIKRFIQNYGEEVYDFISINFVSWIEKGTYTTSEFKSLVASYLRGNGFNDSFSNTRLNRAIYDYLELWHKNNPNTSYNVVYHKDKKISNKRYKVFEKVYKYENTDVSRLN